jgi:hypothetical protein
MLRSRWIHAAVLLTLLLSSWALYIDRALAIPTACHWRFTRGLGPTSV